MDQEDKPIDTEGSQAEPPVEPTTDMEQQEAKPVVVKKTAGFSLFIALLALGLSGYLFYRDWQQTQTVAAADGDQLALQVIRDEIQVLRTDFDKLQVDAEQNAQQLTALNSSLNRVEQRQQTANQSDNTPPAVFDNSNNLAMLQQLQDRLNEQNTVIQQLQTQLATRTETQQAEAHEVLPNTDPFDTQATVERLMVADLLLQKGQLVQAAKVLEDHLGVARTRPTTANQLQNLINQIRRTDQPDTQALAERLQTIKQQLDAVVLPAKEPLASDENTAWYARFVSVKKIADESQIRDSTELALVKAQLSQHLFQAQLALALSEQELWTEQLQQAAQLLQKQLPDQSGLINVLQQLSAAAIRPQLDDDIDIRSIIDELNGLR